MIERDMKRNEIEAWPRSRQIVTMIESGSGSEIVTVTGIVIGIHVLATVRTDLDGSHDIVEHRNRTHMKLNVRRHKQRERGNIAKQASSGQILLIVEASVTETETVIGSETGSEIEIEIGSSLIWIEHRVGILP